MQGYSCHMKNAEIEQPATDPASVPAGRNEPELYLKQALNKLQFEEAVQRLRELHENHPKPAQGNFY